MVVELVKQKISQIEKCKPRTNVHTRTENDAFVKVDWAFQKMVFLESVLPVKNFGHYYRMCIYCELLSMDKWELESRLPIEGKATIIPCMIHPLMVSLNILGLPSSKKIYSTTMACEEDL